MTTNFSVAGDAATFVAPFVVAVDGLTVREHDARLDEPIAAIERRLRAAGEPGPTIASVRAMYKRFGVDPTKTRPSSEALFRRLRKGDGLPRINTVVDVGNWCSVETQLPYGLYDLDQVRGAVELRLGRPGEEYPGIRKDVVHVEGRLTLADEIGPFGNPTSDSARTMVTTNTTRALVVIYAPSDVRAAGLAARALTIERLTGIAAATVRWTWPDAERQR